MYIYLKAVKYANIYLILFFIGFSAGLINTMYALNSYALAILSYGFVVFPIMPFAKLFQHFGLMLETADGTLFPSDMAMLIGHGLWFLIFYFGYLGYLMYKRYKVEHQKLTIKDD